MPTIMTPRIGAASKKITKKQIRKMRKAGAARKTPVLREYDNPNMKERLAYCSWCPFSEEDGDLVAHEKNNHYEENVIQHWQEYSHVLKSRKSFPLEAAIRKLLRLRSKSHACIEHHA